MLNNMFWTQCWNEKLKYIEFSVFFQPTGIDTDEFDSHIENMEEEVIEFFVGEEITEVDEFEYE